MDIARFLDKPAAIVGTTGAGKTFTAKGAVEKLLALGRRVIILDPTGAWYGLRAGASGESSGGFPVLIFGGERADVPIEPTAEAGKALALALAERDVQAIIDTSEMTGGEKNRFLTPFLEHLYAKNKAALHLIVDEADEVAAQRLADGEQRLFGAFDKIVRRGRIKGFRPLMISQRPAVIHKNVLSQIGTLIALKLTSPQDRKAIEEWVKGNADAGQAREVMKSLPTLARGEGWVWSPADDVLERVTFPPIRTFDSSRTPDADEAIVEPALTAVDVAALRETMAVTAPSNVAEKINTPSRSEIEAAEKRGYDRGLDEGYSRGASAIDGLMAWTMQRVDDFSSEVRGQFKALRDEASLPDRFAKPAAESIVPLAAHTIQPRSSPGAPPIAEILSPSARKIVDAVKSVYPRGLSLAVAAKRAGLSSRSSAYRKHMRDASASEEIRDRGDGKFVAIEPPSGIKPPAGTAAFRSMLPPSYAKMLDAIEDYRGRPIDKITIAHQAGVSPTSSGLGSGLRELLALELIIERDGGYALSPDFMDDAP
jgi:hypothetical protein